MICFYIRVRFPIEYLEPRMRGDEERARPQVDLGKKIDKRGCRPSCGGRTRRDVFFCPDSSEGEAADRQGGIQVFYNRSRRSEVINSMQSQSKHYTDYSRVVDIILHKRLVSLHVTSFKQTTRLHCQSLLSYCTQNNGIRTLASKQKHCAHVFK